MIVNSRPLTLAEVKEIVKDMEEKKTIEDYLKKFSKLGVEKSASLTEELRALNNMKLKEEYVVKVADFLPKDSEDLNKIFQDVPLDEKETNEILEIVKKY